MAKKTTVSKSTSSTVRKPSAANATPPKAAATPQSSVASTVNSAMDYSAHEATFHRFTHLIRWTILVTFIVLIVLYFAIDPMIRPS